MPNDVDDRTRISCGRRCESKRGEGEERRVDCKLDYQERETVIWADKLKSMGPGALDNKEGRRGGYCHEHANLSLK